MMTQYYSEEAQTNYTLYIFFTFLLLYSHYVAGLIKKLELGLMIFSVLLKIKFGHRQSCISVFVAYLTIT